MAKELIKPRTFFLNETHELSPVENSGGGRPAKYGYIPWSARAKRLSQSLKSASESIEKSLDPLKGDHYFVIATPIPEVEKLSENKKKYPTGKYLEPTDFGGAHNRVFDKIGLDLLQVAADGRAVVHGDKEKIAQISNRVGSLETLGSREQSRWVTIDSFAIVPQQMRVEDSWLNSLRDNSVVDFVVELQPVLTRSEVDRVLNSLSEILANNKKERFTGNGTDFSGRYWFRVQATRDSIRKIAKNFFSIQSLHPPLYSAAAGRAKETGRMIGQNRPAKATTQTVNPLALPCVAIVDSGVPAEHVHLRSFRRGQFYPQEAPRSAVGDHGSLVASRVVFGDHSSEQDLSDSIGQCSYFDAIVARNPGFQLADNGIDDKLVIEALRGTRGAAPDVRVFNLSIGDARAFDELNGIERTEKRRLMQDLDNFIFANDCGSRRGGKFTTGSSISPGVSGPRE